MIIQMSRKKGLEQISIHAKEKSQKVFNENLLFSPVKGKHLLCSTLFATQKYVFPQILGTPPPGGNK